MIPLLRSTVLTDAGFVHGFSSRLGGVSKAPYESLDFALLRDPEGLRENQARLAAELGVSVSSLYQVTQVHGDAVVVADGDPAELVKREADALVAEPGTGHAALVRVADCVPVLLADPASGRVAAIHAGWRGFAEGVVPRALSRLATAPGAGRPHQFVAAIGPCIGPCCFEVETHVADRIMHAAQEHVEVRRAFPKAFVDLRRAVRAQLEPVGVTVEDVGGCTRCDAERFYSFRRDGERSGRLVGAIVASGPRARV
jgi:YfiH family protein